MEQAVNMESVTLYNAKKIDLAKEDQALVTRFRQGEGGEITT